MKILAFYQGLSRNIKITLSLVTLGFLVLLQGSLTNSLIHQKPLDYGVICLVIIFLVLFENGRQIKKQIATPAKSSHILLFVLLTAGLIIATNHVFTASENQKTVIAILNQTGTWGIIHTCLIAPVLEELIYRGQILSLIDEKSSLKHKIQCCLFATVFFAGMHVTGSLQAFWQYLIPSSLMVFGYAKYKGLAITIPLHIAINILAYTTM